jgi:uncharacterized protein
MTAAAPATGVPSPCINVCRIHPGTGWCEGCLRTLEEITVWSRLDDAGKTAVLQQLSDRRMLWARRLSTDLAEGPP